MEMEETLQNSKNLAAPLILFFVLALQLLTCFLEHLKKGGLRTVEQKQLRQEINQLLKEASSLSTPSTFAKAAKLRRIAAAKEKELMQCHESHKKEKKWSYDSYLGALRIAKVFAYLGLSLWFWGVPVAAISIQLLQPFAKILSWKAGGAATEHVAVGIIPWLVLTNRVSKFICHKIPQ